MRPATPGGRKDDDGNPILRKKIVRSPVYETVTEPVYKWQLKPDAVLKPTGVMYDRLAMVAIEGLKRKLAEKDAQVTQLAGDVAAMRVEIDALKS